jgi:hypothetical protein
VVVVFDGALKVTRQSLPTLVTVIPVATPTSCIQVPSLAVTKVAFALGAVMPINALNNGARSETITVLRTR